MNIRIMNISDYEAVFKLWSSRSVVLVVFESNTDCNAFWENHGFTSREDLIYRNRNIEPTDS